LLEHERPQWLAALGATFAQRRRVAVAVRRRPLPPRRCVEALAQELEEAVGFEPAAVRAHELRERPLLLRARERRERRITLGAIAGRVDARGQLGNVRQVRCVDEPRVARVRRSQGVGRAVRIGDTQR
jgi:tRNA U54 and U55 pseudouridine synthase Pus10